MLKVFLADGNEGRRAKIRKDLSLMEIRVELIGEASDGALALPKIRDLQPDVLIADADMPFMNGIELCRAVSRTFPWMQILITGGTDDPIYDERVRSLGATRLRPPFNAYELNEVLAPMRLQREKMLPQALHVLQSEEERRSRLNLGVERQLEQYLAGEGTPPEELETVPCRLLLFHSHGESTLRMIRACFAMAERRQLPGHVLVLRLPEGIGAVIAGRVEMRLENAAYIIAHTIQMAVKRLLNKDNLAIRVGEQVNDAESLRRSYESLREMPPEIHEYRPIYGKGDAMRRIAGQPFVVNVLAERLCTAVPEELPAILDECLNAERMTPEEIAAGCAMLAHEVKAEGDWTPRSGYDGQLEQLRRAVALRDACFPEFRNLPLSRARSAIAGNFCNPMLMLYDIAQESDLSPGRLCVLFQQELGWSFTDYLARLRIMRSMRLLRRTRTRISTIAKSVGYHDHAYFENAFRVLAHVSPADYRRGKESAELYVN